jgi:hypothetical protein
MTIEYNGEFYTVIQNGLYVSVDRADVADLDEAQVWFCQGEESTEYADMDPADLLSFLDGAGVL